MKKQTIVVFVRSYTYAGCQLAMFFCNDYNPQMQQLTKKEFYFLCLQSCFYES